MQLGGLAAQLLAHLRQAAGGVPEAQDGLVHGLADGAQAGADQGEVSSVVHLGNCGQIAVRHAGQHLLDVRYVAVDALYRVAQGVGQHLQLVSGADLQDGGMEIAAGQGHHPVRYAPHRLGDGPGQAQHQQDGHRQHRRSGQHCHQHGAVDIGGVIRLGHLDDQGPAGAPDGGEGRQHGLAVHGELCGAGFVAGRPEGGVLIAAGELADGGPGQDQGLVRVAGDVA